MNREQPLSARLSRPPRAQRETAVVAALVELDRQNLVQLNDIRLKLTREPAM